MGAHWQQRAVPREGIRHSSAPISAPPAAAPKHRSEPGVDAQPCRRRTDPNHLRFRWVLGQEAYMAASASTQRIGTATSVSLLLTCSTSESSSDAADRGLPDSRANSAPWAASSASTVAGTSSTWVNPVSAAAPRQAESSGKPGSAKPSAPAVRNPRANSCGTRSNRPAESVRQPPGRREPRNRWAPRPRAVHRPGSSAGSPRLVQNAGAFGKHHQVVAGAESEPTPRSGTTPESLHSCPPGGPSSSQSSVAGTPDGSPTAAPAAVPRCAPPPVGSRRSRPA